MKKGGFTFLSILWIVTNLFAQSQQLTNYIGMDSIKLETLDKSANNTTRTIQEGIKLDWAIPIHAYPHYTDYILEKSMVLDTTGNIYTTGFFTGSADFDPDTSDFILSENGAPTVFLAKYNNSGQFIFAKKIDSNAENKIVPLDLDNFGNIIIAGRFHGLVDFDPDTGEYYLNSLSSFYFSFIAKYKQNGKLVWAKSFGGEGAVDINSIAVDDSGSIYSTGFYSYTIDFNPDSNSVFNLNTSHNGDVFICKIDSSGTFLWAKSVGGNNGDLGQAITIDNNGNSYTAGWVKSTVDFDPNAGVYSLPPISFKDAFILKLDAFGNFCWAKRFGGTGPSNINSLSIDFNHRIYCVGQYFADIDLNPDSTGTCIYTTNNSVSSFVSKFDNNGNFLWGKSIGTNNLKTCYSIPNDNECNLYLTGSFFGTVDFDPGPDTFLLNSIQQNIFVCKLDSSGNLKFADNIGENATSGSRCITVDPSENIYLSDSFSDDVDFDPTAGDFILSAIGSSDGYILKLNPCFVTSSTITVTSCNSYLSPSGNHTWTESGTYTDYFINDSGCDSIITIDLTIYDTYEILNSTACDYFNFNGTILTNSGTYFDTIPQTGFCDSIIQLNLVVNKIDTTVSTSGNSIGSNEPGAVYQWYNCTLTLPILNATAQYYIAQIDGSYAVIITKNGCIDTSNCRWINVIGIEENGIDEKIKIYPNPANDKLYIDLGNSLGSGKIELINNSGQVLIENKIANLQKLELNIRHLPPGEYFIRLIVEEKQVYVEKVVKE